MKVFFIRFLVVLLALQGAVAAQLLTIKSVQAADPVPAVVINELMWMGSTESSSDEWIELRNTTDTAVDISGWLLTNSASGGGTLTIPAQKSIPANGYFLISNFNETNTSSILNIAPDWTTTNVLLANTCSPIDLMPGSGSETIIDSMGCDEGDYFFPTSSATKHSLERNIVVTDGLFSTSWHESDGFVNLDSDRETSINRATPKFINDADAPNGVLAVVNDGKEADIDWSADGLGLTTNWSGFTDPESDITGYWVGLGTTIADADFMSFVNVGLIDTYNFVFPVPTTSGTFYTLIKAINGAGMVGAIIASDGFTIDLTDPTTPTGLTVTDVPSDNGGNLKAIWSGSTSNDGITYQLNYRQVGGTIWTSLSTGVALEAIISTLSNAPTSYEFTVEAIDFNNQHSVVSSIVIGQALDNLAPIIDPTKIVISQNKPGVEDTIFGLAGTSNEPDITAYVFYQDPALNFTTPIPMTIDANGGFTAALGIGDNVHDNIWVQLFDGTNLSIATPLFINDIIGPSAPVLNKAVANCASDNCRVNLEWQTGSADTVSFKVFYTFNGVDHQTFEVSTNAMAMDLPSNQSYQFKVIGFDQFGNPSVPSNVFSIVLTKGVITTVILTNGQPITTTEGISGSRTSNVAVVPKSIVPAEFVPTAKAAAPIVETADEPDSPLVQGVDNSRDWVRILVVVILLLIIASSFYALSRSVQATPEEEFDQAKKNSAKPTDAKRRGRPRRRTK